MFDNLGTETEVLFDSLVEELGYEARKNVYNTINLI